MLEKKQRIVIVYGRMIPNASEDDLDVLDELEAVSNALKRLGFEVVHTPFSLDLAENRRTLQELSPDCIFNLVESIDGTGRYAPLAPMLFEIMHIPYTGFDANAFYVTTDKVLAKELLAAHSLPTPRWQRLHAVQGQDFICDFPVICKLVKEDASVGISDASVAYSREQLEQFIEPIEPCRRQDYFIEEFIEGREFNVSVLESAQGIPVVLPPAEMVFTAYPEGKPMIVGYEAKWKKETFEYTHTVRSFEFLSSDDALVARIKDTCLRCWDVFHCKGYARVDIRVDRHGTPFILEVNANPCITPGSGFAAASSYAGNTYEELVDAIMTACKRYFR